MVPFLRAMPSCDRKIVPYLYANQVPMELPLRVFDWETLILKAKLFFKTNFNQFLMMLCGGIVQFHYKKIIELEGKSSSDCVGLN
jgi:hypothetical protein